MDMNPKLVNMVEKDVIFEDAGPKLFGDKFAKATNGHED